MTISVVFYVEFSRNLQIVVELCGSIWYINLVGYLASPPPNYYHVKGETT